MYKFSNPENTLVQNLVTGYSGIGPDSWMWEDYQTWLAGGGVTAPYKTIDDYQREVKLAIITEAMERRYGGLLILTYWVASDPDSRLEYLGLKDLARDMIAAGAAINDPVMADGSQAEVETLNGVTVPMTCKRVKLLIDALQILDQRLRRVSKYHISQMMLSADPANYDYSAGWPAIYTGA